MILETTQSGRPKLPTAKWGAACAPCATAKAKCIRSNSTEGSKCDRCHRLYKECSNQIHRPRKKRQARPSRTAQLEDKLNGLVNYLKVSGDWSKASSSLEDDTSASFGPAGEASSPESSPSPSYQGSCRSSATGGTWSIPERYNSYAPPSCICRSETEDAPPPPDSDDALLHVFKTELATVFPFVIVPDDVTALELTKTRPFLMSSIRMVASYRSLRSMRAQMFHLISHVSDYMLIRSERSLDLLLGLIVIVGWYQYHCLMHAQLNNLIALASTLLADLGLNREPGLGEKAALMMGKASSKGTRRNEEKRAFAGVWYLSSAMSIGFAQKTESMRYTYYLDECVKELEANPECPSDQLLASMVRIQHLTERISRISCKDKTLDEVTNIPTAPMSAYITTFHTELELIIKALPESLQSNVVLQTHINTARLRLHEPPSVDSELLSSISESLTSAHPVAGSPLDRIYQSAAALRIWFDQWMSIPASLYYLHTTAVSSQIVYALVMLSRWARVATPRRRYDIAPGFLSSDPSSSNPNDLLHPINNALTPVSATTGTSTPRSPNPSEGKTPCQFGISYPRVSPEPTLPAAVALLRSRLARQPDLHIDCPRVMVAVMARFEEASAAFEAVSVEEGQVEHNVWSMSAMKLKITQVKLMRWAEMVEASVESLEAAQSVYPPPPCSSAAPGERFQHSEALVVTSEPAVPSGDMMMSLGFDDGDQWMDELMGEIDPTLWLDGHGDWVHMPLATTGMIH